MRGNGVFPFDFSMDADNGFEGLKYSD